jgi:hypothetical protein
MHDEYRNRHVGDVPFSKCDVPSEMFQTEYKLYIQYIIICQ